MRVRVHLPEQLVRRVEARAKQLGVSRSGYVATALERDLERGEQWSPGFFARLRVERAPVELKDVGRRRRSRNAAPAL